MSSGGTLDAQFRDTTLVLGNSLLGEAVTYTAVGAPGDAAVDTAITAMRIPTPDVLENDTDEMCKWVVRAADIAAPRAGDRVTDDGGEVWTVVRSQPQLGGHFTLTTITSQEA